jgi:hypothetical protein
VLEEEVLRREGEKKIAQQKKIFLEGHIVASHKNAFFRQGEIN